MFQPEVVEKTKIHICIFSNFLFLNSTVYEIMWENTVSRTGHRRQYGACVLHAWYRRLQMHTQNN